MIEFLLKKQTISSDGKKYYDNAGRDWGSVHGDSSTPDNWMWAQSGMVLNYMPFVKAKDNSIDIEKMG